MSRNIGVLGCGWLGLPTAIYLKNKGHIIKGTTTSADKQNAISEKSIPAFLIKLTEDEVSGNFKAFSEKLEVLIVNVPPRLRKPPFESYAKKMGKLVEAIQTTSIKKVIFVSSTSVYGNINGEVNEATTPKPNTESGRQLLEVEKLFKSSTSFETTIIRFAGLIGEDRHPVKMLSKKEELFNGNEPVNLIHLNDCIRIIEKIIDDDDWGVIVNGVYPYHPTKEEYYIKEAKHRGLPIPNYAKKPEKTLEKIVKSSLFPTFYQHPITSSP